MSKRAIALLKALERSQRAAQAQYNRLWVVVQEAPGDIEATEAYLHDLKVYLEANNELQIVLAAAYGLGYTYGKDAHAIAVAAMKKKITNQLKSTNDHYTNVTRSLCHHLEVGTR